MANAEVDETGEDSSRIISVLAETHRRDRWTVAPRTSMITLLARSHFDFRKAEAPEEPVIVNLTCVFGHVTFVVPEGTNVELSGFSFLASSTSQVESSEETISHLPKLVIVANTVFGRVTIRTPNDIERGIFPIAEEAIPAAVATGEELDATDADFAAPDFASADFAAPDFASPDFASPGFASAEAVPTADFASALYAEAAVEDETAMTASA